MSQNGQSNNGHSANGHNSNGQTSSFATKVGLAEMLKGGVIMDVANVEQARIAEAAGRRGCYGIGTRAFGYSQIRRRRPHERPENDQGSSGRRHDSRDGEMSHRPHRRSAHFGSVGRRFH